MKTASEIERKLKGRKASEIGDEDSKLLEDEHSKWR
jgi:hypothetical protein